MKENEFIETPDTVVEAVNAYFSRNKYLKGEKIDKYSIFFFKKKKRIEYYSTDGYPPIIFSYDRPSNTAQFAYNALSLP